MLPENKQANEDQQAISDCQMGKTESYRILVERYKTRAYYAALMFTGNREDALDISQEAFFRAFKSIKSFEKGKNFYTWLYRIVRNLCINHFHRIKKRSTVFSDVENRTGLEMTIPAISRPDEIFEEHELRDVVWKALNSLSEKDREILLLKEFNELSYKEISETLDIPIGSVMSRLYYARKKLARTLKGLA
jgi:RNA polymerase sigma-70 factor (ECF subfamily)